MSQFKKEAARRRRRIVKLALTGKYTQAAIADRCKVSQQYVNKIEKLEGIRRG